MTLSYLTVVLLYFMGYLLFVGGICYWIHNDPFGGTLTICAGLLTWGYVAMAYAYHGKFG